MAKNTPGEKSIKGTVLLEKVMHFLGSDFRALQMQGGTRCFAPGTLVAMSDDSYCAIEDVAPGYAVLSIDPSTDSAVTSTVGSVSRNWYDGFLIRISNPATGDHFDCTPDHRIMLPSGDFVEAEHLFAIDPGRNKVYESQSMIHPRTVGRGGFGTISRVRYVGYVYDIEVSGTHTYCVTGSNVVVHNSSKTYSIAQGLAIYAQMLARELPPGETFRITIMRKRFPSLRGTAMRDFFEILQQYGWYTERDHNKTENEYQIGPVQIEFLSLDDPQKIRGRKRDIAWLNEANEFTFEDFKQINLRTTKKVILDYNPSDEYHWIYDHIEPRPDTMFVKSTYRDNPFLSDEIIKEIEWLQQVDDNAWRVYGMGDRGSSGANIYPRFEIVDTWPEEGESAYGLDFGHNNPSALVEVKVFVNEDGKDLYVRQLMYEKKLTTEDIISRLGKIIDRSWLPIYADSSSPDRIDTIFRAGFNIKGADKRNYSVKDGIDFIKTHRIHVHADSEDLIREIRGYKWRMDNNDKAYDEPVKFMDHALDAMRYAAYTHFANPVTWLMA